MIKFITILLSSLILFSQAVNAQYIFRDLNIINGLADTQIRSISMAPDKRMTIGTRYVLDIYDGSLFSAQYHDRSKEYKWANYKPPKEYYDSEGRIPCGII